MNYNFFTSRMVLINENGDTVQFRQWRDAKILNLDGHVFCWDFDKGYMEIILQGPLALSVSNRFILIDDESFLEKAGMTDQANASPVANGVAVANYDRMFKRQKTYFFLNERNMFLMQTGSRYQTNAYG